MPHMIGSLVGGFLITMLLAILTENLVWQRVCDDPLAGKLLSVLSGWLTVGTLAGWGLAEGGPYYWGAFVDSSVPALPVALFAYWRGMKLRAAAAAEDVI